MDCWMYGAWSNTDVNVVPSPIFVWRSGSILLTAVETSTVFESGVFVTEIVSAGLPSTSEIEVTGSSANATVATAPMVEGGTLPAEDKDGISGSALMSETEASFTPASTE